MNPERLLQLYDRVSEAPDAIPRLRKFILDLAVRGKLVEQDPDDESATELLARISRAKALRVGNGEVKSRPDLPDVLNEGQYNLPSSWNWVRFGNLADFSAGRTPSRNDTSLWNTGDYAWVSIADMVNGEAVVATKETVSNKARSQVFKCEPEPPGTIIMSFKLTIGKTSRLQIPAFHNEAIISIRPHLDELDPFLFRVLPDLARGGETKGAIKGATLNRESISNILVPLPPLAEQHRIVAKVDELMSICDSLEAEREKREATRDRLTTASLGRLTAPDVDEEQFKAHADFAIKVLPKLTTGPDQIKVLRQTILDLAVRGKLVEQSPIVGPNATLPDEISREQKHGKIDRVLYGDGGLGSPTGTLDESLPNGWRWTTLGLVAESLRYGTSVKCGYKREGVPVLRIPNVSGGTVDLDDLKFGPLSSTQVRDLTLEYEDILLIRSNGSLEIVGRAAVVPREAAGMAFAGYLVRLRPDRSLALGPYLWLVLNSSDVRTQVEKPIRTTVGLKNINLKEFSALTFRLPPLSEQRRIVAMVDQMMIFCNRFSERLGVRSAIMTSLLEGLLTRALAPN